MGEVLSSSRITSVPSKAPESEAKKDTITCTCSPTPICLEIGCKVHISRAQPEIQVPVCGLDTKRRTSFANKLCGFASRIAKQHGTIGGKLYRNTRI